MLPPGESLSVYALLALPLPEQLWAKKTSFTKLEVHKILHCHQRRIEPWPQFICKEDFMKFECVVFEILEWRDVQTLIAILHTPTRGKVTTA